MEHVERAGVHSGDSMAIYPGLTLSADEVSTIVDYTTRIGKGLGIKGLMNIQYVLLGGTSYRSPAAPNESKQPSKPEVYVIEVNPRSSRTIPFISKVTDVPMIKLAINSMMGVSLEQQGYTAGLAKKQNVVAVKAPVFSMAKLTGVDTYLGPEMKSTGEVMGIDYDFSSAVSKALISAGLMLPKESSVLLSIADKDKPDARTLIEQLSQSGCRFYATEGTATMIDELGFEVVAITKRLGEGHPNVVDIITDGSVDGVINTVTGDREVLQDGFSIRRVAAEKGVPCFTSIDTARAVAESMNRPTDYYNVLPLEKYLDL